MMKRLVVLGLATSFLAGAAEAEPTRVMVRAQAADAKFIGDQMGGVKVTLRDARSRRVLASGTTKGGTGDTTRIMKTPLARHQALADPSTAGFEAVLDLDAPTLVEVEAVGPAGSPASTIRVTSQSWIFPGRDVTGDGWVLSFPGLPIEPNLGALTARNREVKAKVTLMCGCPIEPGGLWNADNYTVVGELWRGGELVSRTPLTYAGAASQFSGAFSGAPKGRYRLRITATDRQTPNAGVWEDWVRLP